MLNKKKLTRSQLFAQVRGFPPQPEQGLAGGGLPPPKMLGGSEGVSAQRCPPPVCPPDVVVITVESGGWNCFRFGSQLKVHEIFPKIKKVTFSLWLHPVKIWLQTVRQ